MNWWQPHNFESKKPHLEKRGKIIQSIRRFFDERGYLEVQTPIMQVMPTADTHIHAFGIDNDLYLHTSPELAMKKLLVAGCEKIYQICPVFRKEVVSTLHAEEFTMLEWYRVGASYHELMDETEEMLKPILGFKHIERLRVEEAFQKYSGIPLPETREDFLAFATEQGIRVVEGDQWDDIFHAVMAEKIEPHLGQESPTFLYDYPARLASLARINDSGFAERFELYIDGIELANGFGELTDAVEQRRRFEADMAEKKRLYGKSYPIDEDFLAALENGMPECSGIALGIDRLVMLASDAEDIKQVLWTD